MAAGRGIPSAMDPQQGDIERGSHGSQSSKRRSPRAPDTDSSSPSSSSSSDEELETFEGMAKGSELHPLQRKFIEHAALQCGICTPGFLMAAKALLEVNPDPTESQIRFWLAGNLCRCTGYDKIVRAVQDAAAELRGDTP